YELCFALGAECDPQDFQQSWAESFPNTPLHCIGKVDTRTKDQPKIVDIKQAPLPHNWAGYEHFHGD
ncbi:MAG: hypothetical protein B7X06_01990, partial [Verrucomicrobia bacterium 21-51-4]